jgi:hypothetical protein
MVSARLRFDGQRHFAKSRLRVGRTCRLNALRGCALRGRALGLRVLRRSLRAAGDQCD